MPSFNNAYARQLSLLMDVLPHVTGEPEFALKGGTAINLLYRDLPRLSVDIDLAWLPLGDRDAALAGIAKALGRISQAVQATFDCEVRARTNREGVPTGLAILRRKVPIKIDVTPVMRGTVFEPELRNLQPAAAERYGFLEVRTLGFADLFAGKLVAALDRQHPRDLFDVMHLLANEGITDELWLAFLVYMMAASRPEAEMIDPNRLPLQQTFVDEFAGMTEDGIDLQTLERAREAMIAVLHARIDDNVGAFLLSVEREEPEWHRLRLPTHVPQLPAVRWKLVNLGKRSPEKRDADYRNLVETLARIGVKNGT